MARREGLISARKSAGLTQVDVASLVGIPRSLYGDIELGKRPLRVELAKRLSDLLDLKLDDLVSDDSEGRASRRRRLSELSAARGEEAAAKTA